ncbi:hypothetical protein [Leptospira kirschneri]|uniref:hypothetical protein n=1 Tax=Leptospira kirschneri TaxID=29507 RepID=UPI00356706C6
MIEIIKGDGFRYFVVSFSLSRLYNGDNFPSYSPFDYDEIVKRLKPILDRFGYSIKDWKKVKVSRLDVFLNVELDRDYKSYFPIIKTGKLPRTEARYSDTSKYSENKSFTLLTYDKKKHLQNIKGVNIEENVLRFELRYLNGPKIKRNLGSNLLHKIKPEKIEEDFYVNLQAAYSGLKDFSLDYATFNRLRELIRYFKSQNNRFPEKNGLEANTYLRMDRKGEIEAYLLKKFNVPLKRYISIEAQKKKRYRDKTKILHFLSIGLYVEDAIRWQSSSINLIRNSVFHQPLKLARLNEEYVERPKRIKKEIDVLDLSFFSLEDCLALRDRVYLRTDTL